MLNRERNLCNKLEGKMQRKYKKDRQVYKCKTVGKVKKERHNRKIFKERKNVKLKKEKK